MNQRIVLLHGSANGASSWSRVHKALVAAGHDVVVPEMLGYGAAQPSAHWNLDEELDHLARAVGGAPFHLVTHSLGTLFGLHLRRRLGPQVTRLTLVEPFFVQPLREAGDTPEGRAAAAEATGQYEAFGDRFARGDVDACAEGFVDHWNGPGFWRALPDKAKAAIRATVPKVRKEMITTVEDTTPTSTLLAQAPPTTILVGNRTKLAPPVVARVIAGLVPHRAGGPIVVVDGATHLLPVTHPQAVVDAVTA